MFPTILLPDPVTLQIETIETDNQQSVLILKLIAKQTTNQCPVCQTVTGRIHSRYTRRLADLAWADWRVRLEIQVRRFFCDAAECSRRIFTERMPDVTAPWARRTTRLAEAQRSVGLAVGASMGARVMDSLNIGSSDDVVLCLIRQAVPATGESVRMLGVDDWALRNGHTYGTILVDLEKGEPIEVLPDRKADTLAAWLRRHPEVEIISRDRAGAYAEGATVGAPQAQQVADRWHLLKNLGDGLVRVLDKHHSQLKHLAQPIVLTQAVSDAGATQALVQAEPTEPLDVNQLPDHIADERQQQRREARLTRFEEVRALAHQGVTVSAIAQYTGLDRKTVRKFIDADVFPERQQPVRRASILDPYKAYLRQRWAEGCRTVRHLWTELQALGFSGGRTLVVEFVAQLRQEQGLPKRSRMLTAQADKHSPLTPRAATWLILKRPDQFEATDHQLVAHLRQLHPDIDTAITLVQDFATLFRNRLGPDL
ncbi:MAG: ISL3 family transposase [Aggregatilineales bacterium]